MTSGKDFLTVSLTPYISIISPCCSRSRLHRVSLLYLWVFLLFIGLVLGGGGRTGLLRSPGAWRTLRAARDLGLDYYHLKDHMGNTVSVKDVSLKVKN